MSLIPRTPARPPRAARQVVDAVRAAVERWSLESHRTARRNAELATGRLAVQRAEREDVEAYLSEGADGAQAPHPPLPRR